MKNTAKLFRFMAIEFITDSYLALQLCTKTLELINVLRITSKLRIQNLKLIDKICANA